MHSNHMRQSPLFLDGWLEFNHYKWGLQPLKAHFSPNGSRTPAIEAVYYLNRAGKLVHPKLNPYLPIAFEPTPTQSVYRIYRQWLTTADLMVQDMRSRGMRNSIEMPPEIIDMRPWQWAGFRVEIRYTFYVAFPLDLHAVGKTTRERIRKAQRAGYTCRRTCDMAQVLACLQASEQRQHFTHELTIADLERIRALLGDEYLRIYLCYAPDGTPASARLILHRPGGRAIGWIAGSKTEHLPSGAAQLLDQYTLEDLQAAGAIGFDFVGANISHIAAAKTGWGGRLVPSYVVEALNLRTLVKWTLARLQFMRTGEQ